MLTFCAATHTCSCPPIDTGKIFVKTFRCSLEVLEDIWMFSGSSRRKRYIPVHKGKTILRFLVITVCDTMSHFVGFGQQKVWKAFDGHSPDVLEHLGEESRPNANAL